MTDKNELTFNLNEEDVEKSLTKIVESMSNIRMEAITKRNLTDEQKDEYLHLTYRLATIMKSIASDETMKNMNDVATLFGTNEDILNYDPLQAKYWERKIPEFNKELDAVTISILRDNLHSFDDKHHVANAIKFLASSNLTIEEKEKLYDTIVPFTGALDEKQGTLEKLTSRIFGQTFEAKKADEMTLEINGKEKISKNELEDLIEKANELGYTKIRSIISKGDFNELRSKYNISATEQIDREDFTRKDYELKGIKKAALYSIYATWPFSYLAIGALPESLQQKLESSYLVKVRRRYDTNTERKINTGNANIGSIVVNIVGGIGLGIAGGVTGNPLLYGPGIAMGVDGISRLVTIFVRDDTEGFDNRDRVGSPFLKPFLYPLESYLNSQDESTESRALLRTELNLRDIVNETGNTPFVNVFDYFQNLAEIKTDETLENNLIWSEKNHNSFGKKFAKEMNKAMKENKIDGLQEYVERENNAYILSNNTKLNGYNKDTVLICKANQRYIISGIGKDVDMDLKSLATIINSEKTDEEKIKEIIGEGVYAHLVKYESGNLVKDLEVFK